jgi:hypothetical protein
VAEGRQISFEPLKSFKNHFSQKTKKTRLLCNQIAEKKIREAKICPQPPCKGERNFEQKKPRFFCAAALLIF